MIKLAHRGYVGDDCRENSSAAILKAIKLGYDMVEVDIRETKDQQIILSHDQNLNRVFGLNKKVNNLTLKDIQTKNHLKLAETTIDRLKDFGIDAINVDSYYHQFLY